MSFLASLVAFALVPFGLLAVLPARIGVAMLAGVFVAAVAFLLATSGTDFPVLPASLIVAGAISGLVTGGFRVAQREHDAPWHVRVVTLTAGAAACVPVWLVMTFSAGMLVASLSG
jgi:hypothetical protein